VFSSKAANLPSSAKKSKPVSERHSDQRQPFANGSATDSKELPQRQNAPGEDALEIATITEICTVLPARGILRWPAPWHTNPHCQPSELRRELVSSS
jgi:hypothetical protein